MHIVVKKSQKNTRQHRRIIVGCVCAECRQSRLVATQLAAESPLLPICVNAYSGNPYMRYCVQWISLYALLRAMHIPICVTASNGNSYMRYCVQWKSL